MRKEYIQEIDSLRALAVISVILFHLDTTWLPGGFLGVDVFFVISGFLITSILLKETEKERKKYFYDFYLRRTRRIAPTLLLVILTTILASYFILLPENLSDLGESSLASSLFVSNIYFYLNTGYFDAPTNTLPLLHTWSLSVEEQFYIIWPVIILVLAALDLNKRRAAFASILIISLTSSSIITIHEPSLAFFNTPFRMYQFMLGAAIPLCLATYIKKPATAKLAPLSLQLIGITIIIICCCLFTEHHDFPGYLAFIPSAGAVIFIIGAIKSNKNNSPITFSIFVWLGKISFSLYLWHWPLITLYKAYLGNEILSNQDKIYLLLATLTLSIISYTVCEKPLRKENLTKTSLLFSGSLTLLIFVSYFLIQSNDGFSQRVVSKGQIATLEEMWEWPCPRMVTIGESEYCNIGKGWENSSQRILLWGDSHAEHMTPYLEAIANNNNLSIILFKSCRPLTDGSEVLIRHKNKARSTEGCLESTNKALNIIKHDNQIKLVILAGRWDRSVSQLYTQANHTPSRPEQLELFRKGLEITSKKILDLDVDLLLLGDTPSPGGKRNICHIAASDNILRKEPSGCPELLIKEVNFKQGNTEKIAYEIAGKNSHAKHHSIIDHLCNKEKCSLFLNDIYIFRDGDHLRRDQTKSFNQQLSKMLGLDIAMEWHRYKNH